jgi:hypothetical protein
MLGGSMLGSSPLAVIEIPAQGMSGFLLSSMTVGSDHSHARTAGGR